VVFNDFQIFYLYNDALNISELAHVVNW